MYNRLREDLFDWDEANISHIARHRIAPEDAEHVLLNDPVDGGTQDHAGEQRSINVGVTAAMRVLVVITTWRNERLRVVTAYPASPSARAFYQSERRSK